MNLLNKIDKRVYIALSGILLGICVTISEVGALSYLALIPLALVLLGRSNGEYGARSAYADGFCFFMPYYLVTFHWFLYFYPLDFTGMDRLSAALVVALAWVGIPLLQSVFSALVFVAISYFLRTKIYKKDRATLAFFASALFVLNEWSQTLTWAGVPWSRIGISHTKMPVLAQSASLFGTYFITFIVVLFGFLVATAIISSERRRFAAAAALTVLLCNLICGAVLYTLPAEGNGKTVKIAALQGNLPSQEDRGFFYDGVFEKYEKMTLEAAEQGAQIIFWPEGVFAQNVEGLIVDGNGRIVEIDNAVSELSVRCGATVVLGTIYEAQDGNYYNSTSVFYQSGGKNLGAYSKIRLVPFGEFIPLSGIIKAIAPVLGMINTLPDDLTPGKESSYFESSMNRETSVRVGTLMCFDSIFETLATDSVRGGAQLLYIPSDDSWFYDSRALDMHHSQNILRAIETGRYTVSCGNTGITSIVDSKGNVLIELADNKEGFIISEVPASDAGTLYSYIGNSFVIFCAAAAIVPFIYEFAKKRTETQDKEKIIDNKE